MANLADTFAALIAKHDVHVIEIGINTHQRDEALWSANIHWEGFTREINCCVIEHGPTPEQAVVNAIKAMILARTSFEVEPVAALEIGEAA
jgi:hypothetical protein